MQTAQASAAAIQSPLLVPLLVAVIGALVAAVAKFVADSRAASRANRLQRVDRQLEQLYGPLLALTHASAQAWKSFRQMYRRDKGGYWSVDGDPPSEEEAEAWRLWMTRVFMPLNDRVERTLVEHAHLLKEDEMPPVVLDLCAHVEAYRGIVKEWKAGTYRHHKATVHFPLELAAYAERAYRELKQEQAELLRTGLGSWLPRARPVVRASSGPALPRSAVASSGAPTTAPPMSSSPRVG